MLTALLRMPSSRTLLNLFLTPSSRTLWYFCLMESMAGSADLVTVAVRVMSEFFFESWRCLGVPSGTKCPLRNTLVLVSGPGW